MWNVDAQGDNPISRNNGDSLETGIHSAAKLYAKLHPTEENAKIRTNEFKMKLVE